MAKKRGAPSKYSDKLFKAICFDIANTSRGTKHICEEHEITYTTFKNWINDDEDLFALYARAKDMQADMLAEEIISIADDSKDDTIETFDKHGKRIKVEDKEWTSRSKLRIDARKWVASKLKPKKYGDKIDVTSKDKEIQALPITGMVIKNEEDEESKD